jgi:soluble lytic murein transglycosylase-like protein
LVLGKDVRLMSRLLRLFVVLFALIGPALAADAICLRDGDAFVLTNLPTDGDCMLLVAAPVSSGDVSRPPAIEVGLPAVMNRAAPYRQWLAEAAELTGVDHRLLQAVAAAESGFNPGARSVKGAQGIMQLIPATAKRYGLADAYDARLNILAGARYLADLMRQFDNDVNIALAAYNAGEQAVIRFGHQIPPYRETRDYVPRVMNYYRALMVRS